MDLKLLGKVFFFFSEQFPSDNVTVIGGTFCIALEKQFELERWIFVAAKSSAAGFHSELWNNDTGDDLSGALAQYSMYPLTFLAVLLHDRQSSFCGTPAAICSQPQNESDIPKAEPEQKPLQGSQFS